MPHRLLLVFALAALPAFPVAKEILQLQRDLALLQEQVRSLQKSFDERLAVTQQLLNQNLEASNKLHTTMNVLEKTIATQEKLLVAPVANVGARVDTLATQFQALRESVEETNSKLSKLQQMLVDIKNVVTALPPPPAQTAQAPAAPPVSAETLYRNAYRDFQAGNYNLAGPQFADYIKNFGSTDQAADAQFYLAEIFYQQNDYDRAAVGFDAVLERYPQHKRCSDAQYKKGLSLLKSGQREGAIREFREVLKKYPGTPAATQSTEALAGLGIRPAPAGKRSTKDN